MEGIARKNAKLRKEFRAMERLAASMAARALRAFAAALLGRFPGGRVHFPRPNALAHGAAFRTWYRLIMSFHEFLELNAAAFALIGKYRHSALLSCIIIHSARNCKGFSEMKIRSRTSLPGRTQTARIRLHPTFGSIRSDLRGRPSSRHDRSRTV